MCRNFVALVGTIATSDQATPLCYSEKNDTKPPCRHTTALISFVAESLIPWEGEFPHACPMYAMG